MSGIARLAELVQEVPAERFFETPDSAVWTAQPGERVRLSSYSLLDAPAFPSKARKAYFASLGYHSDPLKLYRLEDVQLAGSSLGFWVDGELIAESVEHWLRPPLPDKGQIRQQMARRMHRKPLKLENLRRLEGIWLWCASRHASNHYHWHVDLLPAVIMALRLKPPGPIKVLLDEPTPIALESLAALGFGPDDIHCIPAEEPVVVDQLLFASSFTNVGANLHPKALEAYREIKARLDLPQPPRPGRWIFSSRGAADRRRLVNRSEIEAAFVSAGFEVINPAEMPYREQARMFHEAEVVVGEHGANLSNAGFCGHGALICELFHPDHNDLCYVSLAEASGLLHRSILGSGEGDESWRLEPQMAVAETMAAIDRRSAFQDRLDASRVMERTVTRASA